MKPALSPRVSEFETDAQKDSYTKWLADKVEAARKTPLIPHDQVMARAGSAVA